MLRVRRTSPEPRIELMPLIDVVFLLLTFFVFAMVLMVRADVLDLNLPTLGAAEPAREGTLITIGLDADGSLFVGDEPVDWDTLAERVRARRAENPEARLVVAADLAGGRGELIRLFDLIAAEELGDVALIGRREPEGE